jgi:hypothetical protein
MKQRDYHLYLQDIMKQRDYHLYLQDILEAIHLNKERERQTP